MAVKAFSYDDVAIREDLLSELTNLSPRETQLVSGLATTEAKNTLHSWLIKSLGSVKTNAYVEGADASYDIQNPTRLSNLTQAFLEGWQITDTDIAVNRASGDRKAEEIADALAELKNDMEYALMRGSLVTGNGSSAARQLRGLKLSLSLLTNASAASMSESTFNDYLQMVWDNSNTEVNAVYCPIYIKRKIAGYSGAANDKTISIDDKRLVNAVDVYSSDAASLVKLFKHRYVTVSGDTNYDIVGLNEDYARIAYLIKPHNEDVARTGLAEKGFVTTELTLEVLHPQAGFWVINTK